MLTHLALITACSPPTQTLEQIEPGVNTSNPQVMQSPKDISAWIISGGIAAKNHKKTWTASLNWQQQGPHQYEIRLFGPLGGGTVLIEKHGAEVIYRDGDRTVSSKNPDALLYQETGVHLPVSNLYYWVRGIPAPGPHTSTNHNGQLLTLNQAGYQLQYTEYTTVNNMVLPTKIQLEGHGERVKLVIKQWNI